MSTPKHEQAQEPLWRDVVGGVLRRERRAQRRTLQEVADAARISMQYLSEIERGRKEASSELLAAAAGGLGLSLADLLTLAQEELVRLTAVRAPARVRTLTGAGSVTSVRGITSVRSLTARRPTMPARQGEVRLAA